MYVRLIGKALSIKCKTLGRTLRDGCDSNMWNDGEEHEARGTTGAKEWGLEGTTVPGSEDSDGCGPATVRRRGGLRKGNRQLAPGDTIHHSRGHNGD